MKNILLIITNLRHILDIINKRDLIISIYGDDNYIELWNAKNWECLSYIQNINNTGFLLACFLNTQNQIYILKGEKEKYNLIILDKIV